VSLKFIGKSAADEGSLARPEQKLMNCDSSEDDIMYRASQNWMICLQRIEGSRGKEMREWKARGLTCLLVRHPHIPSPSATKECQHQARHRTGSPIQRS
jgi:hypothetical protein